MKKVKVAIIGAGSAGLSALRQVKEQTDSYLIIDQTPLGTKCARTGCMPSKALIIAAGDYHRRGVLKQEGILGSEALSPDIPAVLRHVRSLRDRFAGQMESATRKLAGDHFLAGRARLTAPDCIQVDQTHICAERIIIATGSSPMVPAAWQAFGDRILTSDTLFEQPDLPRRIGVIGLGPIGLEIGQALSRLGLKVVGFDRSTAIGGLTDPAVNQQAIQLLSDGFPLFLDASAEIVEDEVLYIKHPDKTVTVDAVIAAMGVIPNLKELGLEKLNVELDERGVPPFDPHTLQIADLPVFLAGDVNGARAILHEALDEGVIAGLNSAASDIQTYCRRTPLLLVFTDPQIAAVGQNHDQLKEGDRQFVIGKADFKEQSRAMLELRNHGLLHLYADRQSARILGAEMICPGAGHLAHQLAIAVQHELTVFDMLKGPFYHPTAEEALRTALQDAAGQLPQKQDEKLTLSLCKSCPEPPLR
jgi:dihydrolipoamide dehydrogenase